MSVTLDVKLLSAVEAGDERQFASLIKRGADVWMISRKGSNLLQVAAMGGHTPICLALLAHGLDIDRVNRSGWSALHLAAERGETATCLALMDHGADVNGLNNLNTALHGAALYDHAQTSLALIERGANVQAIGATGHTPLHEAAWRGSAATCALLLAQGCDLSVRSDQGLTALDLAIKYNRDVCAGLIRSATAASAARAVLLEINSAQAPRGVRHG